VLKAFDKVWHEGLIFKLRQCGIAATLMSLLENYLSDRSQRVVLNGKISSSQSISARVARGYITGPSLFSIWANDVKYYIRSSIKLFADDRTFLKEIDSPVNYFHKIDNDIETLNSLSKQWRITVKAEILYLL
jgi:hypothetical protein